ncbi:MAG: carbamoyl phosphate synthase large subunit, partial [Phycisphaerae bacterium]
AMEICDDQDALDRYIAQALEATDRLAPDQQHPILIDRFLSDAIEVDVDAVADGQRCVVAGVMEHIEEAGVHSGDSAMSLPPYSLSPAIVDQIKEQTVRLAMRIGVRGLMNVQYAVKDGLIYVLEVNPRASRTVPFVSKATGLAWAKIATKVMLGKSLDELLEPSLLSEAAWPRHVSVKESVFPFNKFPGVDVILGPEMRSTGEVMGIDPSFAVAFGKSQTAAGSSLPLQGTVFISVNDNDKPAIVAVARQLADMGFNLIATRGTHQVLAASGISSKLIPKISEQRHPNMLDLIEAGTVDLLINTPTRKGRDTDEGKLRAAASLHNIPLLTTITAARAAATAIAAIRQRGWQVRALQDYRPHAA